VEPLTPDEFLDAENERRRARMSAYEKASAWQRGWATWGVIVGFPSGVLWGFLAYFSRKAWKEGRKARPLFAWVWATFITGLFLFAMLDSIVGWGIITPPPE
jgi:hypothetical protein